MIGLIQVHPTTFCQPLAISHLNLLFVEEGAGWSDVSSILVLECDDDRFNESSCVELVNSCSIVSAFDSNSCYDDTIHFQLRARLLRIPLTVEQRKEVHV